ncbi:hypothetical protein AMATHDRAFT_4045 [Amanita thiersii Skay4041]|uniref:Retrotransposon gag domain-containing protein n=1 Tax=Amanita thiersii Skay4041 TaxID=703135 RepID=A0A2A9NRU2_9AGAR|nr:hypothetical protein AMATHDRAFT_4045 [Amanita thiersii Skay4041]
MMVSGAGGSTEEPDWSLDQALAQIQQLMNSLAALQNMVHQQSIVIQQLQNQGPPATTINTLRGLKMATPPIYDGVMTTFTWVLGYMQTGMAQLFRDHFLVYMTLPEYQMQYVESTLPNPIKLLYQDIYKVFGDPNKQVTAIQEITMIKQGSKTREEHVQLFKQCYMRSGYGEMAGMHKFKRLLNTPLLNKCMAIPDLPVTLEKWYDLVIRLDRQWRQTMAE